MASVYYSRFRSVLRFIIWTLGTLGVLLPSNCNGAEDRTNANVYENIEGSSACFRRLNATHQIGCSSSFSGDVGVIQIIEDANSVAWVTKEGLHSPYIAVMYPTDFNMDMMNQFKSSGRVSGVLLLNRTKPEGPKLSQFSTDLKCPNEDFGLYNKSCHEWNSPGSGLMYEDFEFPVFFVHNDKDMDSILNCYEQFNKPINGTLRDWPLCAAELKSFMFAAVDTPTCLRRSKQFSFSPASAKVCDPLGDINLWATVLPTNQSEPNTNGSVIVIGARFDGSSMFDGIVPAADSAVTGIVTLLAVLKQLSGLKDKLMKSDEIKNVYFMLFNGEAFGFIGSTGMVYDMKNGEFPPGFDFNQTDVPAQLKLEDIKYFIEIGQVALDGSSDTYFLHQSNSSSTSNLQDILVKEGALANLTVSPVTTSSWGLPPFSLQSFLLERPDLPGVVISNHEKEFTNKFYNSIFDDAASLRYKQGQVTQSSIQTKLANLATTLSNSVLKLMLPNETVKVESDPELIDELLHCYLEAANCSLFQRISEQEGLPPKAFDLYVGVHLNQRLLTVWTKVVMMYFQGTVVTSITDEEKCKSPNKLVEYQWINGSCYESTIRSSYARSPAFSIDNYDWKSGQYPTWVESVWSKLSVRIFLKPSRTHEILTLVSGIIVFIVSFIIVGWVSSKADIIFPNRPAGMAC